MPRGTAVSELLSPSSAPLVTIRNRMRLLVLVLPVTLLEAGLGLLLLGM